jgi:hypothetical protein
MNCKWCAKATEKKFDHKPGKGNPPCFICGADTRLNGFGHDGNQWFKCKYKECSAMQRWHTYWYYDHLNAMADYFEAGDSMAKAAKKAGVSCNAAKPFLRSIVGYWQHSSNKKGASDALPSPKE